MNKLLLIAILALSSFSLSIMHASQGTGATAAASSYKEKDESPAEVMARAQVYAKEDVDNHSKQSEGLLAAAREGKVASMYQMIFLGKANANHKNSHGATPFLLLCANCSLDDNAPLLPHLVQLFIAKRVDLNVRFAHDPELTPLMLAAMNGHYNLVVALTQNYHQFTKQELGQAYLQTQLAFKELKGKKSSPHLAKKSGKFAKALILL